MDEDVIDAIADALGLQRDLAWGITNASNAVCNSIHAIAEVIHTYEPTYDLRYFYCRAGYPEPYPEHPM